GLAQNSPQDAANFVATLPAGAGQNQAALSLASQWSYSDPKSAAAWAANLSGDTQTSAYQTIVSQWAQQDPTGAGNWIKSLPGGPASEQALNSYVSQLTYSDPQTALQFAG